ncbi:hypothetical protein EXN66_Car008249 [Channa argus]|uniref:Uncharacterized protein n=1 Tax=Channa argus TaxID=215402 RepID=A0A6G1PQW6_CHAAH|nr:hypothetical protein EXN66_Car008249 [Channa argus]
MYRAVIIMLSTLLCAALKSSNTHGVTVAQEVEQSTINLAVVASISGSSGHMLKCP